MASMLRYARACAAIMGTSAALLVAAAVPAGAEPAAGLVDRGLDEGGYVVNVGDDVFAELGTSLIGFRLSDGSVLGMYCVEIRTEIDEEQDMLEQPWEQFPAADTPFNQNQDKINWVLHNGFPVRDADALTKALADAGTPAVDEIDVQEAVTATQAAVWHFSDGVDLNREDPLPGDASDATAAADVLSLYDHLIGDANEGMAEQPTAALEVSPAKLDGTAGERIGPFTVKTTGTVGDISGELPEGVTITDKDGLAVDAGTVENGTELFVDVPAGTAPGSATFELNGTASVETGRLFVGENYDEQPTQSLIVADSADTELTATATATWVEGAPPTTETAAPAPQAKADDLAETGASIFAPVLFGLGLIAAGIFSVLFVRSRRQY